MTRTGGSVEAPGTASNYRAIGRSARVALAGLAAGLLLALPATRAMADPPPINCEICGPTVSFVWIATPSGEISPNFQSGFLSELESDDFYGGGNMACTGKGEADTLPTT